MVLLQWCNLLYGMSRLNQDPTLGKLILVQIKPLQYEAQRSPWEISVHHTSLNVDRDLVFTVHRMEMRRRMLTSEHTNHDAKKSG